MAKRLSREAEEEFMEGHIPKIWDELHSRFGFNLEHWKPLFNQYLERHARNIEIVSVFYRFGNEHINAILNQILGRPSGYPTFNNLVSYIVTGKKSTRAKMSVSSRRHP